MSGKKGPPREPRSGLYILHRNCRTVDLALLNQQTKTLAYIIDMKGKIELTLEERKNVEGAWNLLHGIRNLIMDGSLSKFEE